MDKALGRPSTPVVLAAAGLLTAWAIPALAAPANAATAAPRLDGSTLVLTGTDQADTLAVGQDAAGVVTLNGQQVVVAGTPVKVAGLRGLRVQGLGGDDVLSVAVGVARKAHTDLDGGAGADTATVVGTTAADTFGVTPGADGTFVTVSATAYATLTSEQVGIDLSGAGAPDRRTDVVTVYGTDGPDVVHVGGGSGAATVSGLAATVVVSGADPARDRLGVATLGGDDVLDAGGTGSDAPLLALDAGADDDLVTGGHGDDTVDLGEGDDTFRWGAGDGNDQVDGGPGDDTQVVDGTAISERFDVTADGGAVFFRRTLEDSRDTLFTTTRLVGVERLLTELGGGRDFGNVYDLSGTDVRDVLFDARDADGHSDGDEDNVNVFGTPGDDAIDVDSGGPVVHVKGLPYLVRMVASTGAPTDFLSVLAGDGDDVVNAARLAPGLVYFTADGNDGDDVLVGSTGHDALFGEAGDDVLEGNGGKDFLDGGTGSNVVLP